MNVDPACRFCQRRMTLIRQTLPPAEDNHVPVISSYQCAACQSEQNYFPDGRPNDWSFIVGDYWLYFWPAEKTFYIGLRERGYLKEYLFQSDYVPVHLTPQNTDVNRVKTFILFS